MQVDPRTWPVVLQLMDEWLEVPEQSRADWLAKVESTHPELMPTLHELLAQPRPGFLETLPAIDASLITDHDDFGFAPGKFAGPYRLDRELGRGGMGVVWLATRADGTLHREVALKFPLFYSQDRMWANRFAQERDILARLEDARIARLYDAGITAQGQPYLALEYVEGEPVTVYCDRLELSVEARLKLFLEVLHAVRYAHANLVVHRDLKPSNILVTKGGEVRLLDFGIAKLLQHDVTAESEATQLGSRALTPDYASPEQIAGQPVTTASDVYSLGVLLSELLTGSRPSQKSAAIDEAKAKARGGLTPKKLAAALCGDLETIMAKALEQEPSRRYATVDAFAQDIDRHLSGQPIGARPDSAWYRARKFVSRNRLAVSAAAMVAVALAAGAGIALWQAHRAVVEQRRADAEAATARAVSDFLQKDLLSQAGSATQATGGAKPDPDIKVRTALDRAAARVNGKFNGQPQVEAAIRQTIGETYRDLGFFADSETQIKRALELRQRVLGPDHHDTIKSSQVLGDLYQRSGKYDAAEKVLNGLLESARRTNTENTAEAIGAMSSLAALAVDHGDFPRAEGLYRRVVEIEKKVLGEADQLTLASMNNLASLLSREAKYPEAEDQYLKLIELKRRVLGVGHPSTLATTNGLGVLYRNEGKYAEAEKTLKSALEARRRAMGEEHRDTLSSMNALGLLYSIEGKFANSELLLVDSQARSERVLGLDNPDAQSNLNNLAELYRREGKLKLSEAAYQKLLAARLRTYGPDNPFTANTLGLLGEVEIQLHKFNQATAVLRSATDFYIKHKVAAWRRYYTECLLGQSLIGQGKRAEGAAMQSAAYQKLLERKDSIQLEYRSVLEQVKPSR